MAKIKLNLRKDGVVELRAPIRTMQGLKTVGVTAVILDEDASKPLQAVRKAGEELFSKRAAIQGTASEQGMGK